MQSQGRGLRPLGIRNVYGRDPTPDELAAYGEAIERAAEPVEPVCKRKGEVPKGVGRAGAGAAARAARQGPEAGITGRGRRPGPEKSDVTRQHRFRFAVHGGAVAQYRDSDKSRKSRGVYLGLPGAAGGSAKNTLAKVGIVSESHGQLKISKIIQYVRWLLGARGW
jgi:hypothetical protein